MNIKEGQIKLTLKVKVKLYQNVKAFLQQNFEVKHYRNLAYSNKAYFAGEHFSYF